MRRIACIALPEIRLELVPLEPRTDGRATGTTTGSLGPTTRPTTEGPVAVVVSRKGSTVRTERDVLGSTRIDVVSRGARSLGVRAGHTVAAARAKCSDLRVRVVAEKAVHTALACIAEAALAFGPVTGFDVATDVVWVDVGGCAHLHGGEDTLARALAAHVQSMGHACRVAVANGPRISAAIARFGPLRSPSPAVVPPGGEAAAVRALPVEALALGSDTETWLRNLGLALCGDLQKLPRRSLAMRLGAAARDVMPFLAGQDGAPIEAFRPAEVPEERAELEWGVPNTESLTFVLKTLADRLCMRLQGRAVGALVLELVLTLDRAFCQGVSNLSVLELAFAAPLSRPADLLSVLRTRLERHSLAAPVLAVTLRAVRLGPLKARAISLLEPEPQAGFALSRLIPELSAALGPDRVGCLALVDTWVPERRTRLTPWFSSDNGDESSAPAQASRRASQWTSAVEPTRLVPPRGCEGVSVTPLCPIVRMECTEWWRLPPGRRDLAVAWMESSPHGRLAWVELGETTTTLRGWVD